MDSKQVLDYLAEYQKDGSLLNHLVRLLTEADAQGLLSPVDTELFFIFTEYTALIRDYNALRTAADQAKDVHERAALAQRFIAKHRAADGISERYAAFIDYLAGTVS